MHIIWNVTARPASPCIWIMFKQKKEEVDELWELRIKINFKFQEEHGNMDITQPRPDYKSTKP